MADEKLTLELETRGFTEAVSRLGTIGTSVGALGSGGGSFSAAGGGLAAAARLGALASAAALGATALATLAGAAKNAAEGFREFGRLRDTLGSTGSETATVRAISGALGISDPRGLASRVRSGISSGLGAAQAARIGIGPQLDIGNRAVNEGRILLKVLEDIRSSATREEALVKARNFGAEELVEAHGISERLWQQILRDAKEAERLYSPENIERGQELAITMDRVTRKFKMFTDTLGLVFFPILERILDRMQQPMGFSLFEGTYSSKPADANTAATNANTKATTDLIDELRTTNGIFGGGSRARSAVPRAFGPGGGHGLAAAMRAHAVRLGAYAVSL